MAEIPPIYVRLEADVANLKKGLADAQTSLKNLDGNVKQTGGAFGGFGDTIKKLGVTLGATFAASQIVSFFRESIAAANEATSAQVRLREILLTTGGATQAQIAALDAQATALSKVGIASKENITITQSQLATFDLQGKTIASLTPAILDYVAAEKGATASSDDYKQMTNGLAQALQGNFAALTRVGFVLDEDTKKKISNGTESERAAAITEVLNSTYKDFNKTLAETPEGRMIKLKQEFDDLKQTVGEALLPVMQLFMSFLNSTVLPVLRKAAEFVKTLTTGLTGGNGLATGFKKVTDEVKKFLKPLADIAKAVAGSDSLSERFTALATVIKGFYGPILGALKTALTTVRNAFVDNKERIVGLLTTFREIFAWTLKYIVPLFREVLVFAIKQFGGAISSIVKIVIPVVQTVGNAIKGLVNGIITVINGIIKAYNKAAKVLGKEQIDTIDKIGEKVDDFSVKMGRVGTVATTTGKKVKDAFKGVGDVFAGSKDPKGGKNKDDEKRLKKIQDLHKKETAIYEQMAEVRAEAAEAVKEAELARDEKIAEAKERHAERVAELNERYQERVAEANERYGEALAEAEKRRDDQMAQARERRRKQDNETLDAYNKRKLEIETTYTNRIKDLEEAASKKRQDIMAAGQAKLADIVEKGRERLRSAWESGTAFSLKDLFTSAAEKGGSVLDVLKAQLTKTRDFQKEIGALAGKGYTQTFIEQVAKAGPEVGKEMLDQLKKLTPEQEAELQKLYMSMEDLTTSGVNKIAEALSTSTSFATAELADMYYEAQQEIARSLAEVNSNLNANIAEAKSVYESAMAEAARTRDEKLAESKAALDAALAEATKTYDESIADAKKTLDKALLDAQKDLNKGLADAQKDLNKAIEDAMKAFEKAIDEINARMAKKLEDLQKKLSEIAAALKALGSGLSGSTTGRTGGGNDVVSGVKTSKTVTKSVAYSTCPSGKAYYFEEYTDGKLTSSRFSACVIAGSVTPTPVTPTPVTPTVPYIPITEIPRAVPADGSIASFRAGEERSMAALNITQNFTSVAADAWDIHEKTLSAIRYGQAVTPAPTPVSAAKLAKMDREML